MEEEEELPEEELLLEVVDIGVRPVRRSTEGWGDDFFEEGREEPVSNAIRSEPLVVLAEVGPRAGLGA